MGRVPRKLYNSIYPRDKYEISNRKSFNNNNNNNNKFYLYSASMSKIQGALHIKNNISLQI